MRTIYQWTMDNYCHADALILNYQLLIVNCQLSIVNC